GWTAFAGKGAMVGPAEAESSLLRLAAEGDSTTGLGGDASVAGCDCTAGVAGLAGAWATGAALLFFCWPAEVSPGVEPRGASLKPNSYTASPLTITTATMPA